MEKPIVCFDRVFFVPHENRESGSIPSRLVYLQFPGLMSV